MRDILSKRDQRYLMILETLFNHRSKSLADLAKLTKTSKRNVQTDLVGINEFILPMQILTSQVSGCRLEVPTNISIDYLYRCVLKNSLEVTILEELFFEKNKKLESLAESLFISVSTLKRALLKLNEVLQPQGVEITVYPLQLSGDEKMIGSIMYALLLEKYRFDELPFKTIQLKTLDKLIDFTIKQQAHFYTFYDLRMAKLIIMIKIIRIKQGHTGTLNYEVIDDGKYDLGFVDNILFKQAFKSVFQIDLTKENVLHLFAPFVSGKFALNYADLMEIAKKDPKSRQMITGFSQFLENVGREFEIPVTNQEILTLELFNVHHLNYSQGYFIYNRKQLFLNSFLENAPYTSELISQVIKQAAALTTDFKETEIEELLYIFVTHWEDFAKNMTGLKPKFKVGIFLDSDVEHAQYLSTILTEYFKEELEFFVIKARTVEELVNLKEDFSFVITNISNLEFGQITFICIGMSPTLADFYKIGKAYYNLVY